MRFFRSEFLRVHAVVVLLVVSTIILGGGMALGLIPYQPFGEVHGFLGKAIFPALLLLPLLSSKRKNLYRAMKAKLLITKRDIAAKKPLVLAAKVVTVLMILAFLMQLTTGLLVESGLAYTLFPGFAMLSFHMSFLYILPVLIVLHLTLKLLASRPAHKASA